MKNKIGLGAYGIVCTHACQYPHQIIIALLYSHRPAKSLRFIECACQIWHGTVLHAAIVLPRLVSKPNEDEASVKDTSAREMYVAALMKH